MTELIIVISIITLILGYFSSLIGKKLNLIDSPDKSKIHNFPIPITGGIILFTSILISTVYQLNLEEKNFFISIIYISCFFLVGIIDDKINLNPYIRIFFILILSLLFVLKNEFFVIEKIYFEIINSEYYFGKLKVFITFLCILLLYVAMNMADGINGLVILFSAFGIIFLKFLILSGSFNSIDLSIFITLIILLFFNLKNKLFLGNSGTSLLCGYFIFSTIEPNFFNKVDVFEIISIFLIIGIDMVRIIILRISKKRNPFMRDQNHFHYILLNKYNLFKANLIYILLSFTPIILSSLLKFSVLYFLIISIFIYFFILMKTDS